LSSCFSYISTSFRNVVESNFIDQNELEERPSESVDTLSAREKVDMWNAESTTIPDQVLEDEEHISLGLQDHILSNFSKHQDFLKQSKEYQWLLGKIRAVAMLSQRDNNVLADIKKKMNAAFDRTKHKGLQGHAPVYAASFKVALKLQAFLDLYYEEDACQDIGNVITLTGSAVDAQAVTCKQYMTQTWPISGVDTLRALERSLANKSADSYECGNLTFFYCGNAVH
jgi:hypothetical protein